MKRYLLNLVAGLLLGAGILALGACSDADTRPAVVQLQTCEVYTVALATVTGFEQRGMVSEGTSVIVDHVQATVDPICLNMTTDVDATVQSIAIDAGVRTLQGIITAVTGG